MSRKWCRLHRWRKQQAEKAPEANVPVVVAKPAITVEGIWPALVVSTEKQPAWQSAVLTLSNITGMVAARPALPLNTLLGLGEETGTLEPLVPLPMVGNAEGTKWQQLSETAVYPIAI